MKCKPPFAARRFASLFPLHLITYASFASPRPVSRRIWVSTWTSSTTCRVAVGELVNLTLEVCKPETLEVLFTVDGTELRIQGSAPAAESRVIELDSLTRQILDAFLDTYTIEIVEEMFASTAHSGPGRRLTSVNADARELQRAKFVEYRRTGERQLRNELIEAHQGLAAHLARRFANRGEQLDDLRQVAFVGLLKAVERFDPGAISSFRRSRRRRSKASSSDTFATRPGRSGRLVAARSCICGSVPPYPSCRNNSDAHLAFPRSPRT